MRHSLAVGYADFGRFTGAASCLGLANTCDNPGDHDRHRSEALWLRYQTDPPLKYTHWILQARRSQSSSRLLAAVAR